jgi:hypothetical protein
MKGPSPHFQVIGLVDDTTPVGPKVIELEDEVLEVHQLIRWFDEP